MLPYTLRKLIPIGIRKTIIDKKVASESQRISALPKILKNEFLNILKDELNVAKGDTVFVHSSTNGLSLEFPSYNLLNIIMDLVGIEGTVLFPTYPKLSSYEFLKSGIIFDVRKTPTYTGLLNELARRHKSAIRSLHPTKSVVGIGKNSDYITATHNQSEYPYDTQSPYFKLTEFEGKIIGIGVSSSYLSCVHCVEDYLKQSFPVEPYHKKLFEARCIDYQAQERIVKTYAHNMAKMDFNIPNFIRKYIPSSIAQDLTIGGMSFFRADSKKLINLMIDLADNRITIYNRRHYKLKYLL